jgi:hypothetical protein
MHKGGFTYPVRSSAWGTAIIVLLLLILPIRFAAAAGSLWGVDPRPPGVGGRDVARPPTAVADRGVPKYLDNVPPEERGRMQRQYQEWQSLPPDQRDAMRRRMDDWNRMPSQERDRLQQRYRQYQQLPQDERRSIENNLRRWDNLSPQERDSIRRRFKD